MRGGLGGGLPCRGGAITVTPPAPRSRAHIIKLGGSLLWRADFLPALHQCIAQERLANPTQHLLIVVGGGQLVETLRGLARLHHLPDPTAHWLAIGLMEVNTRALAGALLEWPLVGNWAELSYRMASPGVSWALPEGLLRSASPGLDLDESWRVTSDSISACLAVRLGGELTLIKSKMPPEPLPLEGDVSGHGGSSVSGPDYWGWLAGEGFVDPFFPSFSSQIHRIRVRTLPPFVG